MDWRKETVLNFINLIRERPAIWDSQTPDYKIKNKRNDAVEEVAMLMGVSSREVVAKWIGLKNQFSRERRKMTGSGADSIYMTKWYAYWKLAPLLSSNTSIQSINNCWENGSSENPSSPPPQSTPTWQHSTSSNTSTPPHETTTPPPHCSPISRLCKEKKRHIDVQTSVYKEAVETLRSMRNRNNNSSLNSADDVTSYGLYITAHLRKFPPHLQCKAKYEINKILYKLDLENLEQYSTPVASVSSVDENVCSSMCSDPLSPAFESNRRFSMASKNIDEQCEEMSSGNSTTKTSDTLVMIDARSEADCIEVKKETPETATIYSL